MMCPFSFRLPFSKNPWAGSLPDFDGTGPLNDCQPVAAGIQTKINGSREKFERITTTNGGDGK
jgi:hypothetical protein